MRKLRLGVIGAGSWAVASHLPQLARRGDVVFVGVCRHGREELGRIADDWGFQVASEDHRDIVGLDLDIVVVSSPSAFHYEHAVAALESGAHVMVEKPFTLLGEDGWNLVRLAERQHRHLVVAFGYNYNPMVAAATDLLARYGGIGQIESLNMSMSSGTRTLLMNRGAYPKAARGFAPDPATWTDPTLSGGGYAQAQLCHALGIGLWLTGLRARRVYATMRAPEGARVELSDAFAIDYDGGAIGTLAGSSAHPGFLAERDQLHIRAVGDEGHLDLDLDADRVALFRPDVGSQVVQLDAGAGSYDCVGPPNVLADLALGRDVSNLSPGELGARTAELLAAGYRSAQSGSAQWIPGTMITAGEQSR